MHPAFQTSDNNMTEKVVTISTIYSDAYTFDVCFINYKKE